MGYAYVYVQDTKGSIWSYIADDLVDSVDLVLYSPGFMYKSESTELPAYAYV